MPDSIKRDKNRVCPVELAGGLDIFFRRWLQNPSKILRPYINEGMSVLDLGCGTGFFTVEMARMVGKSGHVIACDLQDGMLKKVKAKIDRTGLSERITLHKCEQDQIGVKERVDFVLAFCMLHEVPDQSRCFAEIKSLLKADGQLLVVEPNFHVSRRDFAETIRKAADAGLTSVEGPKLLLSRTAVLRPASAEGSRK